MKIPKCLSTVSHNNGDLKIAVYTGKANKLSEWNSIQNQKQIGFCGFNVDVKTNTYNVQN